MTAHVKLAGQWSTVDQIYARLGGSWKEVAEGYVKLGGAWEQFFASGVPPVPQDGLIFWVDPSIPSCYPGSGTTVYNISPNSPSTGTLYNGAAYSSFGGGSFDFDGSNDYLEFPRLFNGQTLFTVIGFWHLDADTYYGGWMSQAIKVYGDTANSINYYAEATGGGFYGINGVSGDSRYESTANKQNKWTMMTAVASSSALTQFENTTEVKLNSYTTTANGRDHTFRLGQSPGYPGFYAPGYGNGKLAAALIYDRTLTSTEVDEIQSHYEKRLTLG